MAPHPACTKSGTRRQQQREPPIDRYRTVSVCRIVLGEGIEIYDEQEYSDELFHCVGFLGVQRREKRKGGTQRKNSADLRVLLSLRSNPPTPPPGEAFLWVVYSDRII